MGKHLIAHEAADAPPRIQDIVKAIDVLKRNPFPRTDRMRGHRMLACLRLRWSLCQSWMQALARQLELVVQPLPQ
jgi:hypothetical protein